MDATTDPTKCNMLNCPIANTNARHQVAGYSTTTLLEVENPEGVVIMMCARCWLQNAANEFRRIRDEDDEDTDFDAYYVCSSTIDSVSSTGTKRGAAEDSSPNNIDQSKKSRGA